MSANNPKGRAKRIIIVISCTSLIAISVITSLQQIPTISQTIKIYDKGYISALRLVADVIPQNETLTTTENYPQVAYFTDHEVKVPWVTSERELVEFMWRTNSSYLLVPEDTSKPKPDNTPILIQLVEKPFENILDYYDGYSKPKPDNTPLKLHESIKGEIFGKLFEKILDYKTEDSVLHLYHLRSNITRDNLSIVTDSTRPMLSVSLPLNNTIMESELSMLRINVTGSAKDADSNIKKVEISIGGLPFKLANPRAQDDWSSWSFSDIVTEGTKRIVVKATDNADKRIWVPVYITIK
jgi:hypothetical protein